MSRDVIVDSSVAVKWVISESDSDTARRVLDDFQSGLVTLHAPDLIYAEVGNILWKKHVFQGIELADAQLMLDTFRTVPLSIHATAALVDSAFRLAAAHRRTVYDMMYVALGVERACAVVTADDKLYHAISGSFPNVVRLADWT